MRPLPAVIKRERVREGRNGRDRRRREIKGSKIREGRWIQQEKGNNGNKDIGKGETGGAREESEGLRKGGSEGAGVRWEGK